jgi:hypothetical protein
MNARPWPGTTASECLIAIFDLWILQRSDDVVSCESDNRPSLHSRSLPNTILSGVVGLYTLSGHINLI